MSSSENLSFRFACIYNYNTNLSTEQAKRSQIVVNRLKSGRLEGLIEAWQKNDLLAKHSFLKDFLSDDSVLVPAPNSHLYREDSLWTAREICKVLLQGLLAKEVITCIKRTSPIRRSSQYKTAQERPSVTEHISSLTVDNLAICPREIIIVDDVLTLGRTTVACAIKFKEICPNTDIKILAISRTKNLEPFINSLNPEQGTINYNVSSEKTSISNH